jgi:hypothetical protein
MGLIKVYLNKINRPIEDLFICELESNWVEQMNISLEKIVDVMGNWFTLENIGAAPIFT